MNHLKTLAILIFVILALSSSASAGTYLFTWDLSQMKEAIGKANFGSWCTGITDCAAYDITLTPVFRTPGLVKSAIAPAPFETPSTEWAPDNDESNAYFDADYTTNVRLLTESPLLTGPYVLSSYLTGAKRTVTARGPLFEPAQFTVSLEYGVSNPLLPLIWQGDVTVVLVNAQDGTQRNVGKTVGAAFTLETNPAVPEPGAMFLAGAGLIPMAFWFLKKRRHESGG